MFRPLIRLAAQEAGTSRHGPMGVRLRRAIMWEFKPGEKLAGSGSDSSVCRYGSVRLDAGTLARFRAMRKPASYSATFFQPGEDQPEHSCQCAATALGRARSRNTSTSDQLKSACMSTHVDEL